MSLGRATWGWIRSSDCAGEGRGSRQRLTGTPGTVQECSAEGLLQRVAVSRPGETIEKKRSRPSNCSQRFAAEKREGLKQFFRDGVLRSRHRRPGRLRTRTAARESCVADLQTLKSCGASPLPEITLLRLRPSCFGQKNDPSNPQFLSITFWSLPKGLETGKAF